MWKRRRSDQRTGRAPVERPEPPPKDNVYASTEERLIARLRQMSLPEPPPGVKERSLRRYRDWLESQQGGQNRWRD